MQFRPLLIPATFATLALAWLAGCDKIPTSLDDAKKAVTGGVEQAQQVVSNTAETVKQTTGGAGSMELQLDAPVRASGCYAAIYSFSDGRPGVLQITSYNDPSGESFPSVFVRAETTAKTPAELNGKKLSAKVFVQQNPDGVVWQSDDGKPVELTISSAADDAISASLEGLLTSSDAPSKSKDVTGTLNGSFKAK